MLGSSTDWDYEEEPVTFDELIAAEPELGEMRQRARNWDTIGSYCALYVWRTNFKRRLPSLVGWMARTNSDVLFRERSYDTAYQEILRALPICNHEGLCW